MLGKFDFKFYTDDRKPMEFFITDRAFSNRRSDMYYCCLTKAAAKEISVFDYFRIIFAALLGFVVLGQVPDIYSVVGYIVVTGAAVLKWINQKESL